MKVILSHPTGNSFSRGVASGLYNEGMLAAFYTTVATFPGNIFDKLGDFAPFSEFKRRRYDVELASLTQSSPWYELARFAASKAGLSTLTRHETGIFSVDSVYRNLDKQIASDLKKLSKIADKVYAYEDGALHSFRKAKELNMQCLYDLPIGYWRTARRLLEIERNRWPDWSPTLIGFGDSEAKLANKDEELRLADRIFVASSFTASTLNDFEGKLAPVEVIPYAFPEVAGNREYNPIKGRPLKILFVGGLSQRKGIADLFAAVETIGKQHVQLTIIGLKASNDCKVLDEALERHTWIPSLPHNEILKVMREHDVLAFPSLFEGFGLVITEAMSQGTPVITTDRTAGPDLITNDENGWIVEAGSAIALQAAIEDILTNPEKVMQAGKAAMELARKRSWAMYGKEIASSILNSNI